MEFLLLVAFCFWASWKIQQWEREVEEAARENRKTDAHRSIRRD